MAINIKTFSPSKEDNLTGVLSEEVKEKVYNILKDTPLTFIENRGQMDSDVKYYVKGSGYTFYFTPKEVKYSFIKKKESSDLNSFNGKKEFMRTTVAQEFIGANSEAKIEAKDKCNATVNYFKGNNNKKWKIKVPTYERIIYKEIWKGIDLVFYGENGRLKYEFTVQPEASAEDIKFSYKDLYETLIDQKGNLIIKTPLGELIDQKPICYQVINGENVAVKGYYIAGAERPVHYGYKIDNYDSNYPLIIDPGIFYSSYLGGIGMDRGWGIAVDQNGNAYVTGYTDSTDFPLVNAFQSTIQGEDVFITKIDSTPSIVYSSYLGGTGTDRGYEIAIDQSGNAYVTGYTNSMDFPTVNAFQPSYGGGDYDCFITKIDSMPSIVYSSYLGGSEDDRGEGIAVDQNGDAYVTGFTFSNNFPAVNAFQSSLAGNRDAFITKIDSTSSIIYSSYLGGISSDYGFSIAVDQSGNAYVTGSTLSPDFPAVNAFQSSLAGNRDGFITKIDSTPSMVYSSYLGGSLNDACYGIAADQNGNAYVTGRTRSTDFPTVNAFQPIYGGGSYDAFVTKIGSAPSIIYSSYQGGSAEDRGYGIAVDQGGNAYITGYTDSSDFPTANAFQPSYGGGLNDAFVIKIVGPLSLQVNEANLTAAVYG